MFLILIVYQDSSATLKSCKILPTPLVESITLQLVSTNNKLIDKYTNTITQENIEYERDQKEAILNSVIDFLVLSDCRFILGTHYSSFSDEACFMNLICKYCMSSHLSSLGYHTYGYDQKLNMILPNPLVKRYLKFIE